MFSSVMLNTIVIFVMRLFGVMDFKHWVVMDIIRGSISIV